MALGSTHPLTEMSTRFPRGKGGWCIRLTTLPPSCAVVMKSGNLNFLEPSGPLQACNGTAAAAAFAYDESCSQNSSIVLKGKMCHLVHEVYSFSTSVLRCAVMYLLISLGMSDDYKNILAVYK